MTQAYKWAQPIYYPSFIEKSPFFTASYAGQLGQDRSLVLEAGKKKAMEPNGLATETILSKRNQAIISALSKRYSFNPKDLSGESGKGHDIKSLFSNILQLSEVLLKNKDEVMKWVEFADSFPAQSESYHEILKGFNEDLTSKSVLLGDGLKPSEADIIVFAALHSFMSQESFNKVFEKISVEKTHFEPYVPRKVDEPEVESNTKKVVQDSKNVDNVDSSSSSNNTDAQKKATGDKKASEEKKKIPEKESSDKGTEASVSLLNLQVGVVRKAWKHPSADSLLVEEIDLGDGNLRQVVSGLAKYITPEQLTNRHVVLITNVKPGKLRDVMSAGLIIQLWSLCFLLKEPNLENTFPFQGKLAKDEKMSVCMTSARPESPEGSARGQFEERNLLWSGMVTRPGVLTRSMTRTLVHPRTFAALPNSPNRRVVLQTFVPDNAVPSGHTASTYVTERTYSRIANLHEGKPEDVLNPKKKQLEKITPVLAFTSDEAFLGGMNSFLARGFSQKENKRPCYLIGA
ncbi:hypothetical protein ACLOJK_012223 [Asimina triloba]